MKTYLIAKSITVLIAYLEVRYEGVQSTHSARTGPPAFGKDRIRAEECHLFDQLVPEWQTGLNFLGCCGVKIQAFQAECLLVLGKLLKSSGPWGERLNRLQSSKAVRAERYFLQRFLEFKKIKELKNCIFEKKNHCLYK